MVLLGTEGTLAERAELERRLRELEQQIDSKAASNIELEPGDVTVTGGVPTVDGIILVSTIGRIAIVWNNVPISNLKRYEVQIATDTQFTTNLVTRFTRETFYAWTEGDADTTHFLRVRARNTDEQTGSFSAVVNGKNGTVISADIAAQAITTEKIANEAISQAVTVTKTSFIIDSQSDQEILQVTMSITEGSDVLIWAKFSATRHGLSADDMKAGLKKDGVVLNEVPDTGMDNAGIIRHWHSYDWFDNNVVRGTYVYSIFGRMLGATDHNHLDIISLFALEVKR